MKKILLSLVVITMVSVAAVGATRAWFIDEAVLSNNTVASGNFDVTITDDPLSVTDNLEPSSSTYVSAGEFAVSNIGDYNMKWEGKLNIQSGDKLKDWVRVRVILKNDGSSVDGVTCNYGPTGETQLFTGIPLNDLTSYGNGYLLMDDSGYPFEPSYNACYEVLVRLDEATPNEAQNRTLNANLIIRATQVDNPGWSE